MAKATRKITARTMVDLRAKVYAAEGWIRIRGENVNARIQQVYDVVMDHDSNRFVATRRED